MKLLRLFLTLIVLITLSTSFIGCATNGTASGPGPKPTNQTAGDGDRVSSIPWNRPQRWESGGQMGSVMGGY